MLTKNVQTMPACLPSVCPPVCLSFFVSVCLSVCLSVYAPLCSAGCCVLQAPCACTHVQHVRICICICMYVCMYASMYTNIFTYIYMFIQTNSTYVPTYIHTQIRGMFLFLHACFDGAQPPRRRIHSIRMNPCADPLQSPRAQRRVLLCTHGYDTRSDCGIPTRRGVCSCAHTVIDCHFVNTRVRIRCWGPIA